ncbi:MAG: hypothetical protein ACUVV0_11510 [Anaerolineae bacterium]
MKRTRQSLEEELAQRRRNVHTLRMQLATYAKGEEPLHLLNKLEAEEQAVAELERKLHQGENPENKAKPPKRKNPARKKGLWDKIWKILVGIAIILSIPAAVFQILGRGVSDLLLTSTPTPTFTWTPTIFPWDTSTVWLATPTPTPTNTPTVPKGPHVNQPPKVKILPSLDKISPGARTILTAQADDPEKDKLIFTWWAEAGQIPTEPTDKYHVLYTAPTIPGEYTVKVKVSDGYNTVEASIVLKVEQGKKEK